MVERFNREKFKALVHYIIWKAGDEDGFGATKLNKVLWFGDARLFATRQKSITGASYIREKYGPVPKAIMPVRQELVNSGAIKQWRDQYHGRQAWRFKALVPPNVSVFSEEELQTVNWWIDHIAKDHTANSISEESHDYGWEIAAMGEELPFHAFLAWRIQEEPSKEAMEWAVSRAKELGLN